MRSISRSLCTACTVATVAVLPTRGFAFSAMGRGGKVPVVPHA